jgi:hypothetical protein
LYEVPFQERDEEHQVYHYEEREAGYSGYMLGLWNKGFQDRQGVGPAREALW